MRGDEFDGVGGGIAEVDALPAAFPAHPALDRDAARSEMTFPRGQVIGGNRERHVHGSVAVVRGDAAGASAAMAAHLLSVIDVLRHWDADLPT